MRNITTEQIQQMRDGRVRDRLWLRFAPDSVQSMNEVQISILSELLEYRHAEEISETWNDYGRVSEPVTLLPRAQ